MRVVSKEVANNFTNLEENEIMDIFNLITDKENNISIVE